MLGVDANALLARAAHENFPVAPRWLPRALRRDLLAIYGFARLVDQLGDDAPGDRWRALDAAHAALGAACAGRASLPLFAALAEAIRTRKLPSAPFYDLIEANRLDQRVAEYASWQQLRDYCALSANPVGRVVLALFDAAAPALVAHSDAVCTALQLIEHCQDVAEDFARGRIYLPADERAHFGVSIADLTTAPASRALRRLLAFETERARSLLADGEPLLAALRGRARVCIAGYVAGGHAALDALERDGFDVTSRKCAARRRDVARRALGLLARAAFARSPR